MRLRSVQLIHNLARFSNDSHATVEEQGDFWCAIGRRSISGCSIKGRRFWNDVLKGMTGVNNTLNSSANKSA